MEPNNILQNARSKIESYIVDQKSREEYAEIHTPFDLIEEMLSKIPDEEWYDPEKTWLDPAAGTGNFPVVVAERLMQTLSDEIADQDERYRHIMEEQVYMVEIQPKNAIMIEKLLNPNGNLNLNLKCCDALELDVEYMEPSDWEQHRFRAKYKGKGFFQYEPSPEEKERFEKIKEIADKDWIVDQFRRGYEFD